MRTKIILGGALAVLLVGLGSYFVVTSSVERAFTDEVDGRIGSDFRLLERSIRLSGRDLLGQASEQAATAGMADIFGALDENGRRTRAFESANRIASWFQDPARGHGGPPEIVAICDDQGHVVARNIDQNQLYNVDLGRELAAIRSAMGGVAATDVWQATDQNKVLLVGAAPIRGEGGRVVGVLLVGYDLSNGFANSEAEVLGRDVAFVSNDQIYSASFDGATQSAELGTFLAGEGAGVAAAARDAGTTSAPWMVTLGETEMVGVIGPLPLTSSHVAMVVAADRSAQVDKASATNLILVFTLVGLVLTLVYGFVLGASLLKPIELMEESILAIINGRTDLRIQIESAEFGGLAYRINQLLNVLTGTAEADESGRISSPPPRWNNQTELESAAGESPASGGSPASAEDEADPALAAALAAEPEDAYYARVYAEYASAKQAAGENVANIPQDKFVQRLKANEAALVKKHGARMVRFQVQVAGTQVNLKPVVIR